VYVALATAAAWSARSLLALPDLVALYLLVIMAVAVRYGRGPAVVASALSVVAYDVFFVAPHYTFEVHDQRHLLTFAIMFAVGLVISRLALRVSRQEKEAEAATLRVRTEEIRSSLLSAVSHDLRTPLAAITGAGSALRDEGGDLGPAERRELIETLCEEAERLERLVANLLDMTRLEAGALEVKREWVPVEELVGSALGRIEGRLDGRPVVTAIPPDLPLAPVDPVLFEHALVNLLENALKYTPHPSGIRVEARREGADVKVTVADEGPGLPGGEEEKVFEKFYRAGGSIQRGFGLGLPICRAIVTAHGGRIWAETTPPRGTAFHFTLGPLDPPDHIQPETT